MLVSNYLDSDENCLAIYDPKEEGYSFSDGSFYELEDFTQRFGCPEVGEDATVRALNWKSIEKAVDGFYTAVRADHWARDLLARGFSKLEREYPNAQKNENLRRFHQMVDDTLRGYPDNFLKYSQLVRAAIAFGYVSHEEREAQRGSADAPSKDASADPEVQHVIDLCTGFLDLDLTSLATLFVLLGESPHLRDDVMKFADSVMLQVIAAEMNVDDKNVYSRAAFCRILADNYDRLTSAFNGSKSTLADHGKFIAQMYSDSKIWDQVSDMRQLHLSQKLMTSE